MWTPGPLAQPPRGHALGSKVLEELAALLHVVELVEGRARGREKHHIAGLGAPAGGREGLAQVRLSHDLKPRARGGGLVLQRAGNSLSGGAVAHGNAAASGNRVRQ